MIYQSVTFPQLSFDNEMDVSHLADYSWVVACLLPHRNRQDLTTRIDGMKIIRSFEESH